MTLRELIADRIRTSGPISFAEFMEISLYHPELGYYARAAQKTGRAGDFFTSVDVGPIFGELLAKQFAEMWRVLDRSKSESPEPQSSISSRPARATDVWPAISSTPPSVTTPSSTPPFAFRSSNNRRPRAPRRPRHSDRMPACSRTAALRLPDDSSRASSSRTNCSMRCPRTSVVMSGNGLREVFVDCRGWTASSSALEELSTPRIAEYLARAGAEMRVGWRAEVNLGAEDWTKSAAESLRRGFMVLIDYGHDERELYSASHSAGTLTSYKQHSQLADFLQEPGETDITAHVDLTAVTRAAERSGLDVLAPPRSDLLHAGPRHHQSSKGCRFSSGWR